MVKPETILSGKKIIIIGDKDGASGPAIEACVKSAGAEVVFSSTKCFACSIVGGIDFEAQQIIKDYVSKYGAQNIVIVIGGAEAEASGLCAETVTQGDKTSMGPLSGIALGLVIYHVVEPEMKDIFAEPVYEEQCGVLEMILDIDEIILAVKSVRDKFSRYASN